MSAQKSVSIEALARLNPATCRFDIGAGGIPALTTQDFAGALGWTHQQVGSALLELSVNGAGAPGLLDGLAIAVRAMLLAEIERRDDLETTVELQGILGTRQTPELRAWDECGRQRLMRRGDQRLERVISLSILERIAPASCWTCAGNGPKTSLGRRIVSIRGFRDGLTVGAIVNRLLPPATPENRVLRVTREVDQALCGMRESGIVAQHGDGIWKPRCRHCAGTGTREASDKKNADYVGMSHSGWQSARAARATLEWLRAVLADAELDAKRAWRAALALSD